jgi:hypothetical protein
MFFVNKSRTPALVAGVLCLIAAGAHVWAAEWQWSVSVDSVVSQETNDHPRAFLWIPADCQRVRGVVVGQHNMLEEGILEHSYFRQTLAELGLAEVWVTPGLDLVFDFNKAAGGQFNDIMRALAKESGYEELEFAPVVPIGHSAAASYPWNFAAWNPERTLAVLSVHGDAPLTNRTGSGRPNPDWGERKIDGVPGLMVMGEYEWWDDRLTPALDFRNEHPAAPVGMLADVGHGHFDFSDQMVRYLALFLRKAVALRLPGDAPLDKPVELKPIDPRQGWLIDRWRMGRTPEAQPAPYSEYKGNPREAFWCFDREMALETLNFNHQSGRLPQLLGFVQDGRILEQIPKAHEQVKLQFIPLEDGISFRLRGTFLDTVPEGNPSKWAGLPAGSHIGHARGGGPIMISRICGPVAQTGPDTFSIRFYRMGTNNVKRSNDIWFVATHPGDDQTRSAVQQANLRFPLRNTGGAEQHITFPAIPDQRDCTPFLKLNATSDAGAPVYYYVREGPAEIEGDIVKFTSIPPRSRFPVKVTVVAWQWGRSIDPRLKTAEPVERTFFILKDDHENP